MMIALQYPTEAGEDRAVHNPLLLIRTKLVVTAQCCENKMEIHP